MSGMRLTLTDKQRRFVESRCDEVLYGGAAGGGKSFAQLADALIYALRYPASKQLIMRRTYPELERSLIRVSRELYPKEICEYNARLHLYLFRNGSMVEFGSCEYESDVIKYQSAEYDVLRFDELTHFTEYQYLYLMSRVRGVNGFPKQVKSSTNPGGVGHSWVRARFIDICPAGKVFNTSKGSRVFIPALVTDNSFLTKNDPDYLTRLRNLPERERRALLEGDWNIVEGRYFSEFDPDTHTCPTFPIPSSWKKFRAIDYGLDRLACLWVAVDDSSPPNFYVYRELCGSDIIISDAAKRILQATSESEVIKKTAAPPDLWNRSQESGKSKALLFADSGLRLSKSGNDRESGWLALKELLRVGDDGLPRLRIFRGCEELIRCLPMLMIDKNRPSDVCTEPHEITHAPDALRYFVMSYRDGGDGDVTLRRFGDTWSADMWEDYYGADTDGRRRMEQLYG